MERSPFTLRWWFTMLLFNGIGGTLWWRRRIKSRLLDANQNAVRVAREATEKE